MVWLAENLGTIAVLAGIAVAVFFIVRKLRRDAKCGNGMCGCGCKDCAMHGACHHNADIKSS